MKNGNIVIATIAVSAMMLIISVSAVCPTADSFGTDDANGSSGSFVDVPVNITNVQSGPPVSAIIFNVLYNHSVITIVDVKKGELTKKWEQIDFCNHPWGSRIVIASANSVIPNKAGGSVILSSFSVVGEAGETSGMNFSDIQLSGPEGLQVRTAPAKNATFYVDSETKPPEPIPEFQVIAIPAIAVLALFLIIRKRRKTII